MYLNIEQPFLEFSSCMSFIEKKQVKGQDVPAQSVCSFTALFCFDPCDLSASITSRHHRRAIYAYNSRDRPVKNIIVSPTMSDGTQCRGSGSK